jgi:NADH-quinone oxidoreductase subunit F
MRTATLARTSGHDFEFDLYTHTGAGAYECGEESALLESLEGKRGVPRIRPPFPAVSGAFQSPTVLNNVETFCVGSGHSPHGRPSLCRSGCPSPAVPASFCMSGHVNKPGVYEVPLGFPLMKHDQRNAVAGCGKEALKAVIPGGSSSPLLKAEECDFPMDYDSIAKAGSMLGSGGLMVMDETTDMVKVALRIMRFYQHESCGWCIPCREGTTWLKKMLQRVSDGHGQTRDIDLIGDLAQNMMGRTFCPLGDAAAMPTIAIVKKYRNEFEEYVTRNPFASPELVSIA